MPGSVQGLRCCKSLVRAVQGRQVTAAETAAVSRAREAKAKARGQGPVAMASKSARSVTALGSKRTKGDCASKRA